MASAISLAYGTVTGLTVSLAPGSVGLANGVVRGSAGVNNVNAIATGKGFIDAKLFLAIKLQAGTPTGDIQVYLAESLDNSSWPDAFTGSDATIVLANPTNLILLAPQSVIVARAAGALTWKMAFGSLASAAGGYLAPYWGVAIQNNTGLSFDNTEANHTKNFLGVYGQVG